MDEATNETIKVLDHGYVRLIEAWGSDEGIVSTARMSTGKGFLGWGPRCVRCKQSFDSWATGGPCPHCGNGSTSEHGDERLLAHLWNNQHSSPFEFAGLTIEVKAPVFVVREWHRHRTQSYSERSARYTPMPDEHYIPSVERLMVGATTNKQASAAAGSEPLTVAWAEVFREALRRQYAENEAIYRDALRTGVPKELARLVVPVSRYTAMRAQANLRNWFGFLKLRCDSAAQWEIRQYADAVAGIVAERFPRTHAVARESLGLP